MAASDAPTVYAIDFGTSNSLLAAANGDRVFDPIPLDPAAPDPTILRSILCFPDPGGAYVGMEALRQFVEHGSEARLLRSIKHHLGSRSFRGTVIRGRLVTPEALVAVVLREMRERADRLFGTEVRRAVLGRPVHFDGDDDAFAEGRLRKAAQLAGFEEIHLVPEPVAAARAFGAAREREELALVGDFGGGTSDFTVLRVGPGTLTRDDVLAVGGVAVAGDALDASLMRSTVGAAGVRREEVAVVCCTGGTAKVPRLAAEIRRLFPSARMEQFKGFHSVVEGLAREAQAVGAAAGAARRA